MQRIYFETEKSFREMFSAYYVPLVNYASTFLDDTDDAEDIVQEVFVTVWERKDSFGFGEEFKSYLYRSVKNRCLNFLRDSSVKKKKLDEIQEEESIEFDLNHDIIREEVYQKLLETINTLPPQCKKIYQLSLSGMKASEIAEELSLSVETIKAQKKRAKKLLVTRLGRLSYFLFVLSLNL